MTKGLDKYGVADKDRIRTQEIIAFYEPVVGRIHDRLRAVKAQNATLIQVMAVTYPLIFVAYGRILDGTIRWPTWFGLPMALAILSLATAAFFALAVYVPHAMAEFPLDDASFEKLRRQDRQAILSHRLATIRDVTSHNFALHKKTSRWHRIAITCFFLGGLGVAVLYALRIG